MTATVTSLASAYAGVHNELARLTDRATGNGDKAAMSRLVLRAAILNARLHNTDETVGRHVRNLLLEIGQ